ncbi:IclR family transcriptional regulator domain-containing protein [Halobellus sp. GM3]|uniref:IclR family transcriptional regulator domain-containing protein n=1 Tax=Halobellus sp. GM3 TaxID=3458410 RepID=UPI00403D5D9F
MTDKTPPMKSVQRMFEVVQVLQKVQKAGPSEIADRMDLPKSTAHLYLRSLEESGYVINHGGQYELSYRFLTIGSQLKHRNRLFQVSKPEIKELSQRTEELVVLLTEQGGKSFILHQASAEGGLDLGTYPGQPIPLYTHASGKIFLAYMDPERRDQILEEHGLEPVTDETITDKEQLEAELAQIREREYAYDWDEQVEGMGVISVPITVEKRLEGVLSIASPTGRMTDRAYRQEMLQQLRESADTIAIKYRYGS